MDVREKLVELLVEFVEVDVWDNGEFIEKDIDFCKIAEKLIANGVTVQEWIPVTERLPEYEGTYLVYTEIGSIYASHFYTEKRFASGYVREAQWSQRGTVKVTHWMPLPQPPKGE